MKNEEQVDFNNPDDLDSVMREKSITPPVKQSMLSKALLVLWRLVSVSVIVAGLYQIGKWITSI